HRISWDPYNESEDLISQAKKYKQEHGCYPERICADRIYINTKEALGNKPATQVSGPQVVGMDHCSADQV
ncbi:hypothetical protein KBY97_14520, partial [Synechococcus sp. ATX 2A4]|nr:hypothetical protein [Synechococcus sp. ATX 2A4]